MSATKDTSNNMKRDAKFVVEFNKPVLGGKAEQSITVTASAEGIKLTSYRTGYTAVNLELSNKEAADIANEILALTGYEAQSKISQSCAETNTK